MNHSTLNTNSQVEYLNQISASLNRYFSLLIWIFGVVGNILNCLVLSQRKLRSNACAFLFLISSFIELISILSGLTTRILSGWHLDPTSTVTWLCRARAFTVFSTRTLATWLIALASIERWLLSSVDNSRRLLSSLKNVKRGIVLCTILSMVSFLHMLICYEANLVDEPLPCYGKTIECRLATDLIYLLITVVVPCILMLTFGYLTIYNIRLVYNRVHVGGHEIQTGRQSSQKDFHSKKTDRHMFRMLLVQIVFLVIFCIPQAIQKFQLTFQPIGDGTSIDDAIKKLLYNIEVQLAFVASGMPFYIYTLAGGSVFRKALLRMIKGLV